MPATILRLLLTLTIVLFFENCSILNIFKCGEMVDKCGDDKDRQKTLLGLAAIASASSGVGGINITAVDQAGASSDPTTYETSYTIPQSEWTEAAVRRILLTFAFGGPATEEQIAKWINKKPSEAIVEMLTMNVENPYLAQPLTGSKAELNSISLSGLSNVFASGRFVTSNSAANYNMTSRYGNSPGYTWLNAVRLRAMNPFRLKLGLWETNYHLSINLDKNVAPIQMFYFYDSIVNDIAAGKNYEEVIANAAISAPVATQYNHKKNTFVNNSFRGNEDFAREYHQLFFGIHGIGTKTECQSLKAITDPACDGNPENFYYHENQTIRQTAEVLTGIEVPTMGDRDSEIANITSNGHKTGSVTIYGKTIEGSNAKERFASIRKYSIEHNESLYNLPLLIIRGLADENLDSSNAIKGTSTQIDAKVQTIQALWKGMTNKNIVEFIRKYAISTAYHNDTRVKYRTSIDRMMLVFNLITLSNNELTYDRLYQDPFYSIYSGESVVPFRPEHDVFGGQKGLEASDTDAVMINQYNNSVSDFYGRASEGSTSGSGYIEYKNFQNLLPSTIKDTQGYPVSKVAEFLWKRFYGSTDKLTTLEKIHIYSFLASGFDFSFNTDKTCRETYYNCTNTNVESVVPAEADVSTLTSPYYDIYRNYADAILFKSTNSAQVSRDENRNIGYAIDFITSLPFIYVEEGK